MALLLASLGCATAQPVVPGAPLIRHLEIEGAHAVPASLIRARILTSGTSRLPFTDRHYFDESALDSDLKRILRLYQSKGFYKASIVDRQVVPAGKETVNVTLRIDEGPLTRVAELSVEGLADLPETEQKRLLQGLPIKQGDPFQEDAFEYTKAQVSERLRESGFAEANVSGLAQVDPSKDQATVDIRVDTGIRYRFDAVFVAGAKQVPREKILSEALLTIHPGQTYSDSAMTEAQKRIFDLGVFSAVRVTRGAPDRGRGTIPVVVTVREAPFRTLRIGGGIGLDPRRYELPRVTAEWIHRNFLGDLRRLTFSNEAELVVFLPNPLSSAPATPQGVGGVAGQSTLEFRQPELIGKRIDLTSTVGYERGLDQSFRYNSGIAEIGLVWRLSRSLVFVPAYNLSIFNLTGAAVEAARTTTQTIALDECAIKGQLCVLSYLEQRITYDRRNDPAETTHGGYFAFSIQEGSRALGGKYDYVRLAPEARGYFPLGRNVLALRILAGILVHAQGQSSSVLTRFFLGGGNSERGFGYLELAPSLVAPPPSGSENNELLPVGGNGMLASSLELRIPLPADLGLVLFVDTGEVREEARTLSLKFLNVALGLGLRYRTVFGPVRLDFGWRANDPPLEISNPDGLVVPRIPRFAFHFSIGEAF
jgi:translocation and assembly module TamA